MPSELERAYLARSRAVHPDYHLAGLGRRPRREPGTVGRGQRGVQHPPRSVHPRRVPARRSKAGRARASRSRCRRRSSRRCSKPARTHRGGARRAGRMMRRYLRPSSTSGIDGTSERASAKLFSTACEALPAGDADRANLLAQIRGLLNAAKYVRGLAPRPQRRLNGSARCTIRRTSRRSRRSRNWPRRGWRRGPRSTTCR